METHRVTTGSAARRVAVITGASRGLGAAMAARLAREGFFVVGSYRSDAAAAERVREGIVGAGGEAAFVQAELSTVAGVRALWTSVDEALARAGLEPRVDVLVANAGVNQAKPFEMVTEDDFDALFDANVKGVFFLVQQSLGRLRDGGRVITLGSGLSRVANPYYAAYSATKGAIDVLTRGWAQSLGARGITVNTLAPGAIDTDMNRERMEDPQFRAMLTARTALGRIGHAEDIGDIVAFLAGPDSRWVTGQRIEASGGAFMS